MEARPETLSISLLGYLTFRTDRPPHAITIARTPSSVLAYLAIFRGEPLGRDRVAFALWPDETEAEARANLRRQLYILARALPQSGEPFLLLDGRTIGFNPRAQTIFDIDGFVDGIASPPTRASALDLYRGDLLTGLDAEWIEEPRQRYRALFLDAAIAEARAALGSTDYVRGAALMQRVLAMDPWREDAVRMLMECRAAAGDRAAALSFYRDFSARLQTEVGASPDGTTRKLFEHIASATNVLQTPTIPPRAPLPKNVSLFINRERELAQLSEMIEGHRIVTLTGPGGVGKSRLAVEIATKFSLNNEVVNVQLGSASDDARSIEGRFLEGFGVVASSESSVDVIARFIGSQNMLIFIDNADRVTTSTAELVRKLLDRCVSVRFLIASQQRLHLDGEQVFGLQPLAVPSLDAGIEEILSSESARLFLDRARSVEPAFDIPATNVKHLASICRRLDGMPLPIELAAARTNVLTMPEIDARLSDRFEFLRSKTVGANAQHRTLRTTLDWSHDLLDERERRVFRRLGVFANGWTIEAATAVLPTFGDGEVVECLSGLIEKSLVFAETVRSTRRYRYLESIRLYAIDRLDESGERPEVERLALTFFDQFVSEARATVPLRNRESRDRRCRIRKR